MKTDMIQSMSLEAIEVACQSAFEEVEAVFQIVEKNRNRLEYFGRLLTAAKSKVPHGKWEDWITDTFQGRLKIRTASRWMSEANRPDLADLRREKDRTRIAGRVKVVEPSAGETTEDTPAEYQDDDPAPDLPTQRATAAGSRKKPESEKPKTRPVVAEIVQEPEQSPEMRIKFAVRELSQVLSQIDVSERKKTAKQLRKLADELDPPDESEKIPTAAKLQTVCDMECDFSEELELRDALRTWIAQKQKYKKTEWRYQTIESFKKDLKHLRKVISAIGVQAVIKKLDEAERKGWRHWDHDTEQNGKGNNGHSGTTEDRIAAQAARLKDIFG